MTKSLKENMAVVHHATMNGDIVNFNIGPREEDAFSSGNLQDEVRYFILQSCNV